MESLIPDAAILYERADNVVYARYRDPPHNKKPRWEVGDIKGTYVDKLPDEEWYDIQRVAKENPTLQLQLDKLLAIYYIIKDEYKEDKK
jgi:hypothetical protein